MLNEMPDDDIPPSRPQAAITPAQIAQNTRPKSSAVSWLKDLMRKRASNANQIQDVLEDYIEELNENAADGNNPSVENQNTLIANVLKTRALRVDDIMVPRADIVAVSVDADIKDLKDLFKGAQFSRTPVYKDNLDNIIGIIHIKDILACLLEGAEIKIETLVREPVIVTPGMPVMDLFVTMREDKKPMALVVDEHGGIDGLVTINDVIEAIMGDIDDEFDQENQPQIIEKADGSLIVDGRMEIEDFEDRYGAVLDSEEREDVDTLGGLAFYLAGRVPKRGEVLRHDSGMVLEVLDADKSRVRRMRIRDISPRRDADAV